MPLADAFEAWVARMASDLERGGASVEVERGQRRTVLSVGTDRLIARAVHHCLGIVDLRVADIGGEADLMNVCVSDQAAFDAAAPAFEGLLSA